MKGIARTDDALEFWNAIKPKVETLIAEKTKACVRAKRATVVTAPNAQTGQIVVQFPFDSSTISLPYSSAVSGVEAGAQVWVLIPHDESLSNGVVVQNGSWTL